MYNFISRITILNLLLFSLLFSEKIISYQWGTPLTFSSGIDTSVTIPLEQWEILPSGQKIEAPFFIQGQKSLEFRCFFAPLTLKPSQEAVLYVHGFSTAVRVFLNNVKIAYHPNDYGPFQIKLDKNLLSMDKRNTLKFQVSQPTSIRDGYPQFVRLFSDNRFNGVTRPVFLKVQYRNRIHDFSTTLNKISGSRATINFEYALDLGQEFADGRIDVEERITAADGNILYKKKYYFSNARKRIKREFNLPTAYLWSVENPQLLNFSVSVKKNGKDLFSKNFKAGLRKLQVKNRTLFLNAKPILIKGINYHSDPTRFFKKGYYPTLKEHFVWIKQAGFNAIRFPHYLPDLTMADLADSLGILLFPELPVWRYPADLFKDQLLKTIKSSLKDFKVNLAAHPSLTAIGVGKEIPLHHAASQKFMFILRDFIHRELKILSFISPIPGYDLPPEKTADLYVLDIYHPLRDVLEKENHSIRSYDLAGQISLYDKFGMLIKNTIPGTFNLSQEISTGLGYFKFGGCFIESFQDWHTLTPSHLTHRDNENRNILQTGFFDISGESKADWLELDKIWNSSSTAKVEDRPGRESNTVFSIVIVFASILFFSVYRKRPRMRENFRRSMNHPYGFFVDMRERRIIPLTNSLMIGGFTALILSVTFSSFLFFHKDSLAMQEIFNIILSPFKQFENYLIITKNPIYLILFLFTFLFFYPIIVSMILKFISLFTGRKIRYRQALAIGMWSGLPLIFLLPLSLVNYQLLIHFEISIYLYIIIVLFVIWAHYRILNGIRVLLAVKFGKVFIMLLLSYITPFLILWAVQKTTLNLADYLNLIIHAGSLF